MNKRIKSLVMILSILAISLPQVSFAVFKPATLYKDNDRVAVYSQGDAKKYFSQGYKLEQKLGFSVVTDYAPRLSTSMTSVQNTVPVTSMSTKDGHTLTMTDFGSKVFLTIEPGAAKEEIVMCTGISSLTFTGCTRGLAFYGTSTTAVAANAKSHQAGSSVILSNVHFVYEQYVDRERDQKIDGVKTYGSFPIIATSTSLPTSNDQFATKYYVDNVGAGGFTAVNASTTRGVSVDGSSPEKVGVNASSTSGLGFNSSTGALQITASTTGGIKADSNGIYVDQSKNYNWAATNTFSNIIGAGFGGSGLDGALNVTSGTTTLSAGGANVLVKNYTSINISAGATTTISNKHASGTVLVLKSQGNCTIAGGIDLKAMGGDASSDGFGTFYYTKAGSGASSGATGTYYTLTSVGGFTKVNTGAGGASGGAGTNPAGSGVVGAIGTGGAGGGGLIIECAGTLTFTGFIDIRGNAGVSAVDSSGSLAGGSGGGGGGAGGGVAIIYKYISTNTGSINGSGGNGGDGGDGTTGSGTSPAAGSGGGGGSSMVTGGAGGAGNIFGAASNGANGNTSYTCSGGTGGAGGNGTGGGGGGGAGGAGGNYYIEKFY